MYVIIRLTKFKDMIALLVGVSFVYPKSSDRSQNSQRGIGADVDQRQHEDDNAREDDSVRWDFECWVDPSDPVREGQSIVTSKLQAVSVGMC